jgi:hypothetical protein
MSKCIITTQGSEKIQLCQFIGNSGIFYHSIGFSENKDYKYEDWRLAISNTIIKSIPKKIDKEFYNLAKNSKNLQIIQKNKYLRSFNGIFR